MLIYDTNHWFAFMSAAIILNLAPGPDIAFILGQTVVGGKRYGISDMFGIWTGALCHVVFAVVGLSAIFSTSASVFLIVKWTGVVYLAWLGVRAFASKQGPINITETERPRQSLTSVFLQGALGPVDKVDSQISRSVIQDCLLGGGFGSWRPHGYGMADHRGAVAHRTRKEVPALAR